MGEMATLQIREICVICVIRDSDNPKPFQSLLSEGHFNLNVPQTELGASGVHVALIKHGLQTDDMPDRAAR